MTTTSRPAGRITPDHDRPERIVRLSREKPHRQRTAPSASRGATRRDVERWEPTEFPDAVSVRQYGPGTRDPIESILVPIAGGPNSHAAVRVSVEVAREHDARIELLTVVAARPDDGRRMKAEARLYNHADEITGVRTRVEVAGSDDVVATIGRRSRNHELIVVGDSERSVFQRLFAGGVPERLTAETDVPIVVVERTG